ncbi:MAG: hypothetical protein ACTHL6_12150, partial [Arthrobacter sp.]
MNNSYEKKSKGRTTAAKGAAIGRFSYLPRTQGEPTTDPAGFFRRPGSGIGPAGAGRRGIENTNPP